MPHNGGMDLPALTRRNSPLRAHRSPDECSPEVRGSARQESHRKTNHVPATTREDNDQHRLRSPLADQVERCRSAKVDSC